MRNPSGRGVDAARSVAGWLGLGVGGVSLWAMIRAWPLAPPWWGWPLALIAGLAGFAGLWVGVYFALVAFGARHGERWAQ